ncbi:FecR domain-containing protein [Rhodopseudomonas sp. HC1]|uniref:FecR family protein n=1 Tax=Rhodopseudomonas infernalis TaxID=2897386 RepID=UPI001EE8F034|nr:FecR domain-containing protein [Rhodopseudomonas infernalis]MCG6203403.1 FecR domain-containing protein [Rhodopseudomonas infernalis]
MEFASDDSENRERISREAIEWFVRLQNPLASDDTRRAYRDWLMADPAHRDAFRDVSDLWSELDQPAAHLAASGWHRTAEIPASPQRGWPSWGGRLAAAAVVVVALAGGISVWRDPGLIDRALADVATYPGERREVRLADGTLAFLDGDTALKTRMNGDRREITMLRGRVWFDVTSDPARPFTVHAGRVDARVLGTAFEVNREAAAVTVERGEVAVSDLESRRDPVKLTAWQRVALRDDATGTPVAVDPEQMFAWRRGLIILDRAPLSQVVEELDKMAPGRVVITDPELKRLTLSGTFRTNEPGAVLEALRSALGLRTLSIPGVATLIYR